MGLLAARTTAGTRKTPAVFKHITALKTFTRPDSKLAARGRQ